MPASPPAKNPDVPPEYDGRKFRVLHGVVGPWKRGNTFSERTFRELHPPSDKEKDVSGYHNALLARLITVGAVMPVPAETETTPMQSGPDWERTGSAATINAAAKAVVDQKAATAEAVGGQPAPVKPVEAAPATQQGGVVTK